MATFVHSVEWIPIEMSHPPVHNRLIVHQLDSYRNRKLVTDSFQTPPEHCRESFSFFKQKKNSTIHQSAWRCQWQYDWHRNRLINQVEAIDYLLVGPFRRFERVKLVQSIDSILWSNPILWLNTNNNNGSTHCGPSRDPGLESRDPVTSPSYWSHIISYDHLKKKLKQVSFLHIDF